MLKGMTEEDTGRGGTKRGTGGGKCRSASKELKVGKEKEGRLMVVSCEEENRGRDGRYK